MLRLQSEQLRQATADHDREATERHRAQAVQVYLRMDSNSPAYDRNPPQLAAYVCNTSPQPVYHVQIRSFTDVRGAGFLCRFNTAVHIAAELGVSHQTIYRALEPEAVAGTAAR